jgi:hypothetical protein
LVGLAVGVLAAGVLPAGAASTDVGEDAAGADAAGADAAEDTAPSGGESEPVEVLGRDDSKLTERQRHTFPFGTDLSFEGDQVVAGATDWESEEQGGIHLYERQSDGDLDHQSFVSCPGWHTDVDFVPDTPDDDEPAGTEPEYVAIAHDDAGDNECEPGAGEDGVGVVDLTGDEPKPVGFADTLHGAHNLTTVGDTGLVYVSSYALGDPTARAGVSIVDVRANPKQPEHEFLEFPRAQATGDEHDEMENESGKVPESPGCHDIGLDLEEDLAFCAGITETHIWDISDPRDPVIIEIIQNPGINIHHSAQVNADGDVLVINDEWAGATGGPTGCLTPRPQTDTENPTPFGTWSPPEPKPTADFCTSHFFGTFENDDGEDRLAVGWYDNGMWVVDFENPRLATTVAGFQPEGETFWAAYPYKGTLYANSFAPATLTGSDDSGEGGVFVLDLEGYSGDDEDPGDAPGEHPGRGRDDNPGRGDDNPGRGQGR